MWLKLIMQGEDRMVKSKRSGKLLLSMLLSILMMAVTVFSAAPVTTSAAAIDGQAIVNEAKNQLGKPYVWAGKGPDTFDCSGLTAYVYRQVAGIEIGESTYTQINAGIEVSQSELQPGDLVFPSDGHVGIYIGNNQMIHAPKTGDVVKISNVYSFWRARRITTAAPRETIQAIQTIQPSQTTQAPVFDATFYANKYSDLRQAFGYNEAQLYNHWITYGIREGRSASELFDVRYYLAKNQDLINAFGATNYTAAYNHFKNDGYREGRNLSPVLNMGYYCKNNPDVVNAYGNDYYGIMNHFRVCGMSEGRTASDNFNLAIYKSRYQDLVNAFGNNNKAYYDHYLTYGIAEGRSAR